MIHKFSKATGESYIFKQKLFGLYLLNLRFIQFFLISLIIYPYENFE